MSSSITRILLCIFVGTLVWTPTSAFTYHRSPTRCSIASNKRVNISVPTGKDPIPFQSTRKLGLVILKSSNDEDDEISEVASSDQVLLGGLGTFASLVTFFSEYTLFTTGCGLPAGPFGAVGLVEGLSYLGMLGIFSYSVVTKIRTGSGLPAGPFGLLGAAEGLSFLAVLAGLVVLVSQVTNYGYIPNAVPMEGGMCS